MNELGRAQGVNRKVAWGAFLLAVFVLALVFVFFRYGKRISVQVLPPAASCTASSVVSSRQGRQRNGELIPANRSNPNVALGDFSDGSFSLGFGGEIILRFDKAILNGPGSDLTVFEGSGTERRLESAQVSASTDGVNFTFIGNASNQGGGTPIPTSLDLGTLTSAQFIKIVDSTPAKLYSDVGDEASADGFDVAAVFGTSCGSGAASQPPSPALPAGRPACSDGSDNDGDGKIDDQDPGCHADSNVNNRNSYTPEDTDEQDVPQCSDGRDNDGDGKVDASDPGCHEDDNLQKPYRPTDRSEADKVKPQREESVAVAAPTPSTECADGKDNDGDGFIDRADPECHTDGNAQNALSYDPTDDRERAVAPAPVTAATGPAPYALPLLGLAAFVLATLSAVVVGRLVR